MFLLIENFKFKDELSITPDELRELKDLSSGRDIIQKADKGNSFVILNKMDYIKKKND